MKLNNRLLAIPAAALATAMFASPALAASSTGTITVAVTAATQATIGVTYSAGTNITCAVGTAVSGIVPCTNTVTLAGGFRSTKLNTGGASISVTGANIVGTGGSSIPPAALTMTCTGGIVGSPPLPGTPGTLATNAPLSTSAVNCQSWSGTVVGLYSLVVALSIDAGLVPSDTYSNGAFTATATAN